MRFAALISMVMLGLALGPVEAAPAGTCAQFLKDFEPQAVAAGVTAATYERATAGLAPDPRINTLIVAQPEFDTPIWDYLDVRVSAKRIANGQAKLQANDALFSAVE